MRDHGNAVHAPFSKCFQFCGNVVLSKSISEDNIKSEELCGSTLKKLYCFSSELLLSVLIVESLHFDNESHNEIFVKSSILRLLLFI